MEKIRAASQIQQDNAAKELKRKLNRDRKRSSELDGLIQKLYESYATGALTEKRFKLLLGRYEQEQEALRKKWEKQREYSRKSYEKKKLKKQQAANGN